MLITECTISIGDYKAQHNDWNGIVLNPFPLRGGRLGWGEKTAGLYYNSRDLSPSYLPPVRGRDTSIERYTEESSLEINRQQ
jgi:hypothetical protein